MEAIAVPLSFLVLVWVFGGLLAAALPVAIGGMSILGALAVLRVITFTTDVSIFALNLSTALGLALAIDYTLLIISRYRDEMATGATRDDALVTDHGHRGTHGAVLGDDRRAVDGRDDPVPDALPQVVRLRGHRHGRVHRDRRRRRHARSHRPPRGSLERVRRSTAGAPDARQAGAGQRSRRAGVLVPRQRRSPCAAPGPSGWPSSRCSSSSALPSSACGGAFPTTACCRSRRPPARSATSCAATSPTTPRRRSTSSSPTPAA